MSARGEAAIAREILHQQGFYPEESSGLFVGISTFEDENFAPIAFAVDDAVDLAWVFSLELGLVAASRCVLALTGPPLKEESRGRLADLRAAGAKSAEPRKREILRYANRLAQSASIRGLFVASIGTHGVSDCGGDFLIASDSLRDDLFDTAFSVQTLFDKTVRSPAPRRLLFLDACRERWSRQRSLTEAVMSQSFATAIANANGLTVLSGSTAGGYAYDDTETRNGVFSGALVEGLQGGASPDVRGFITVGTLANFVHERVLSWVRLHRQDHLTLSRGIERRFAEAAESMPLAVDPRSARRALDFLPRRTAALLKLRSCIGDVDGAIISHEISGEISHYLRTDPLPTDAETLLEALESLDGRELMHRALRDVWRDMRDSRIPLADASASPPSPLDGRPSPQSQSRQMVPKAAPGFPSVARAENESKENRWLGWSVAVAAAVGASLIALMAFSTKPSDVEASQAQGVQTASESVTMTSLPENNGSLVQPQEVSQEIPFMLASPLRSKQPTQPSNPAAGDFYTDFFGQHYRWIPGGTYTVGSPLEDEERHDNESLKDITISGYWLAETEVTQKFWILQGLKNPSLFNLCPSCPVERVRFLDALRFANILSEKAGAEACYELTSCSGEPGDVPTWEGPTFHCDGIALKSPDCSGYRLPTEAEWEVAARAQLPQSSYVARSCRSLAGP